jgi:hypothetical protein
MPREIQSLRDAAERWRTQHKTVDERLAELGPKSAEWQSKFLERRALEVAIKALDLCITRRVVPRLVCPDTFVTEVVIPPKPRSVESESTLELSRHSHGPVVVECEYSCASALDALALVDDAQRASIFTRGWAPLYVRLWVELLRHECGRATTTGAPQKHEGPRLVVAPEQDEPIEE